MGSSTYQLQWKWWGENGVVDVDGCRRAMAIVDVDGPWRTVVIGGPWGKEDEDMKMGEKRCRVLF